MLWGKTDQANNAPKHKIVPTSTANGEAMFGNTTTGSFVTGQKVGVFAADTTEVGVAAGKVIRFGINSGGTGYTNGDILTVVGVTTNANASVTTNSTGGITSLTIANNGVAVSIYQTAFTIANSTGGATGGSGANVSIYFPEGKRAAHAGWVVRKEGTGGRAGRITYEVLVAGGTIGATDASDDTILPDS